VNATSKKAGRISRLRGRRPAAGHVEVGVALVGGGGRWMVVAGGSETEALPDAGQRPLSAAFQGLPGTSRGGRNAFSE
jgi:hypothetical protein